MHLSSPPLPPGRHSYPPAASSPLPRPFYLSDTGSPSELGLSDQTGSARLQELVYVGYIEPEGSCSCCALLRRMRLGNSPTNQYYLYGSLPSYLRDDNSMGHQSATALALFPGRHPKRMREEELLRRSTKVGFILCKKTAPSTDLPLEQDDTSRHLRET